LDRQLDLRLKSKTGGLRIDPRALQDDFGHSGKCGQKVMNSWSSAEVLLRRSWTCLELTTTRIGELDDSTLA
jgi:hypothetical protein